jgi:peptide-methionine (S)-S-oxide reductase
MENKDMTGNVNIATLAGGCFWCLEAVYQELGGVKTVVSGYTGGTVPNPSYQEVCSERTGHAEAVQVSFDPQIVSYREILDVFFAIHDPTTLNRQGNDIGSQYRSAIFYHDEDQRETAENVIAEMSAAQIWHAPVVTQIEPLKEFYPAEEYHQNYFRRNPYQAYCQAVINPKLSKFRSHFHGKLARVGSG